MTCGQGAIDDGRVSVSGDEGGATDEKIREIRIPGLG